MLKDTLLTHWKKSGIITDENLLEAFRKVRREDFILKKYVDKVYDDYPLPILSGQTISQPTTIMIMTQALEPKPGHRILEIGSGSGYQAAILSEVVGSSGSVVTTEIIPELAEFAKKNIKQAGINNVVVIHYDGSKGYEKEAPYDRIMITAACPKFPDHLINQLKDGGILVAPIAAMFDQVMIKAVKRKDGVKKENLGMFKFVPLKGKHGY